MAQIESRSAKAWFCSRKFILETRETIIPLPPSERVSRRILAKSPVGSSPPANLEMPHCSGHSLTEARALPRETVPNECEAEGVLSGGGKEIFQGGGMVIQLIEPVGFAANCYLVSADGSARPCRGAEARARHHARPADARAFRPHRRVRRAAGGGRQDRLPEGRSDRGAKRQCGRAPLRDAARFSLYARLYL